VIYDAGEKAEKAQYNGKQAKYDKYLYWIFPVYVALRQSFLFISKILISNQLKQQPFQLFLAS
jgi:hypothetical protein